MILCVVVGLRVDRHKLTLVDLDRPRLTWIDQEDIVFVVIVVVVVVVVSSDDDDADVSFFGMCVCVCFLLKSKILTPQRWYVF